jgi:tRNA (guanine-N7-)-methyltransferase
MTDPNDFIITRKRKKYRFAKFANANNCFEFDEWKMQPVDIIEVGAGTGLFSVELAKMHPEKTVVAVDVKGDRLQKGAYLAIEQGVTNIYFVRARADQLAELFVRSSLENIWVTFADPFPKKRSAGRRMTHPTYLKAYKNLLSKTGALLIKHDNPEFFQWTLEQLVNEKWRVDELSFDLHESELSSEYKILTTYETRWLGEGRRTYLVKAVQ